MICIWFFPSFFPLFTILLDLEFVRFWGCCVGFNSWKDIRWTPCQVNQAESSWARFFTLGRISWENHTSLDGYFRSASFPEFLGFDSLGISSNTPKNHLNRVWEFLEAIQLWIFGKNFRDLSWSRKPSRPPDPTGQTGSLLSSRPPRRLGCS